MSLAVFQSRKGAKPDRKKTGEDEGKEIGKKRSSSRSEIVRNMPPPSLPKINLNANKKAPGGRWETEEEEVIK
jgi:hypothetical protein